MMSSDGIVEMTEDEANHGDDVEDVERGSCE